MRVKPTVAKHPASLSPVLSNTTSSPPLSPSPYDASSEDGSSIDPVVDTETDRELDESFLLVRRDDDELSTTSTVGTSLRDSMIAELSDTSAGSVSEGSVAGDTDLPDPFESDHELPSQFGDSSLIEGSYTEADVRTSTSLGDSRSTLQDSSIKLIFPDPVASFTSSNGTGGSSDSTTPSGSLANLIRPTKLTRADSARVNAERIERLTRGSSSRVDESWLASSRMWGMSPEMEKMMEDLRPYQRLGSIDVTNLATGPFGLPPIAPGELAAEGTVKQRQGEWRKVSPPPSPSPTPRKALDRLAAAKVQRNQDAKRALAQLTSATLGSLGKKWGIVAIASMLSLALLGTVGPNAAFSMLKSKHTSPAVAVPTAAHTTSTADHIITQLVPDLLSIKEAISTFSAATHNALVPDAVSNKDVSVVEQATVKRRRRTPKTEIHFTATRDWSVSERNANAGLSLRTGTVKQTLANLPRSLRDKLAAIDKQRDSLPPNATRPLLDPQLQPVKRLSEALSLAKNYSLSAYTHMDIVFGPILAALERELGEIYRLTSKLIRTTSAASGPALEKAHQAIRRAQKSLDRASRRLYSRLSTVTPPHLDKAATDQALHRAQVGLQSLTDYIEGQAGAIQEQSAILLSVAQQKSLESLKQARRGLDRLIDMLSGENSVRLNVERDGPMPFDKMASGGGCSKCRREARERNRRKMPKVKRSRWSRVSEAIHHAAVQFVL